MSHDIDLSQNMNSQYIFLCCFFKSYMNKKGKKIREGDPEKEIKKYFPAIYEEIKNNTNQLDEEDMKTTLGTKKIRQFRGYSPTITDFICRCKTKEEALEIIEYMLKMNKITENEANAIKKQLKEKGLRSFGEHRAPGYYERV